MIPFFSVGSGRVVILETDGLLSVEEIEEVEPDTDEAPSDSGEVADDPVEAATSSDDAPEA